MHGARRSVRPGGKGPSRVEPTFGARSGAPKRRRPLPRITRRKRRLRRAVARHPLLYKALRATLLAAIWGTIVLGLAIVYFISSVPDPIIAALDDRPPNVTILAEDGTVLAERGLRRGHVRLDVLPPYLTKAVLATEDRRFYQHFGIDPLGLVRASFRNASAGTVVEGGSTITQQLAKNLFLSPKRTMTRKLEEVIYAIWLEQRFTKDEILELYLNRVYFGGGTYGIEAAARRYFGRSARSVTLPQAALLAGLLKAPSRYAPTRSVRLGKRQGRRGARQHGRGRLPYGRGGARREPAAAPSERQGRRHRLPLRRRLGGRALARVRRRERRRSDRRHDHRCRRSSVRRSCRSARCSTTRAARPMPAKARWWCSIR